MIEVKNIHPIKESFEIKDLDKVNKEREKNKKKDGKNKDEGY